MFWRYVLKRLGQTVIVMLAVSIIAFLLVRIAPGSPARMMLPDGASEEAVANMEAKLGLDKPLVVQYFKYISGVLQGDLGTSTTYKMPVVDVVSSRFPISMKLSAVTMLFSLLVSIPLSIIAGTHQGKLVDFMAMCFAILGQSMSTVWMGVLNILIFAVTLGVLPAVGYNGFSSLILPAITLGYPFAATVTRMGRSGMIDVLHEDYITAMRAKGIDNVTLYMKYAFKNAMIPIVTLVGMQLGFFMSGAIVTESIFGIPGIGQLLELSIGNRDYAMVQSLLLIIAAVFAILNLVVDIVNSLIDPRIKLQ